MTKSEVPECGLENFHWDTFPIGEKVWWHMSCLEWSVEFAGHTKLGLGSWFLIIIILSLKQGQISFHEPQLTN